MTRHATWHICIWRRVFGCRAQYSRQLRRPSARSGNKPIYISGTRDGRVEAWRYANAWLARERVRLKIPPPTIIDNIMCNIKDALFYSHFPSPSFLSSLFLYLYISKYLYLSIQVEKYRTSGHLCIYSKPYLWHSSFPAALFAVYSCLSCLNLCTTRGRWLGLQQ